MWQIPERVKKRLIHLLFSACYWPAYCLWTVVSQSILGTGYRGAEPLVPGVQDVGRSAGQDSTPKCVLSVP